MFIGRCKRLSVGVTVCPRNIVLFTLVEDIMEEENIVVTGIFAANLAVMVCWMVGLSSACRFFGETSGRATIAAVFCTSLLVLTGL